MARDVSPAISAALASNSVELYHAIELILDSAPLRLWTGFGDRVINGKIYTGSGALLQLSGVDEVADLSAQGITVTLSGMSTSIISAALQEPYQGRAARVYLGETSVSDALLVFDGFLDVLTIQQDGDLVVIETTIESKLVTLQRANVRRYTEANQKLRHPSDTFFDFTASLVDKEVVWGRSSG